VEQLVAPNAFILFVAGLMLVGVLSSLVAQRFGAPLLLVFLVVGMLVGEDGPGGVAFADYQLTYVVGSISLAIILFDGGLRARHTGVRRALAPAVLLATAGVVITGSVVGLAVWLVLGLAPLTALLVGAVVSSTDAAAVFFLVRAGGLKLRARVNAILEIESGTNDPVAVFLTLLLVELVLAHGEPGWTTVWLLVSQAVLGTAIGLVGGAAIRGLLNRVDLPGGLHPIFVIAAALAVYALAAVLEGSGFLAVYLAGLAVGNRPMRASASVANFHDAATWLCQIAMFMLLGLLVTPSKLLPLLGPALLVAAALTLLARPLAVLVCLTPFRIPWREQVFVGWVGLRGAVSIFLATIPMLVGVPGAEVLFNVAFVVVLASLLVQGWTLTPLARRLGLALPGVARPVHRVEIDLPGQLAHEVIGYPVTADSAVAEPSMVPRWARPVFVIRAGQVFDPAASGPPVAGDYAYFLAPPDRAADLDRLFSTDEGSRAVRAMPFLPIDATAKVAVVAGFYGGAVAEEEAELTVAELFDRRFEGAAAEGDVVDLDVARLLARAMRDGRVAEVGVILVDPDEGPPSLRPLNPSRVARIGRLVGLGRAARTLP
jgi:cell volume regulation protein A